MFTYRLILKDGSPADPPVFTTATPQLREGDTFFTRRPVGRPGSSPSPTAATTTTPSGTIEPE
jgi:hypothetical protein